MTTKKLPVIILTENNLDFVFDIFDKLEYRVGLGVNPGTNNSDMREVERKDIQRWNIEKNPAIVYVEIDPKRKRYIPLTKWFEDKEEIRSFISKNVQCDFGTPENYFEIESVTQSV